MQLRQLPVEATIDSKRFIKEYLLTQQPVVVRNFIDPFCPAMTKWNIEYLKEKAGHLQVKLYGKENEFNDHVSSLPVGSCSFSDYLDMITTGPTELRLFLFNLLQQMPDMKQDIIINDLTDGRIVKWLPYLFFGGAGSSVRYHYDIDMSHVLLTQLEGEKEVWLFAPEQSVWLYRIPFNFHGLVNLQKPEAQKYPGVKYLSGLKCTLQKGDTVFIPACYWHYIQYTTGGYSVSHRIFPAGLLNKLAGFSNIVVTRKFDNIMRSIFKDRWFSYKLALAHKRANKEIQAISAKRIFSQ
ncbi:cupin-like domain-containing protein [Parafilimonas sp.]|uniref:cupin-like domain-containing protein n=1 Tax=Parafilimonas sp. TaxID=1969739 RepID=UPI0039E6F1F3